MLRPSGPLHVKYRPLCFDEVFGKANKATTLSLKTVLADTGNCPHTFLLHGPSGCGKTTLARIIKEVLGCGELDFKELNAANTRGVDTIREVISQCGFPPLSGPCRVFLLDECHQITSIAQEALLKITEDAPPYAYFILSTTNPEKLITTLRKRCASYAVSLLNQREVAALLRWVLQEEKVSEEDIEYFLPVISEIAKLADGTPRDALIMLTQCIGLSVEEALANLAKNIRVGDAQINTLCQQLIGPDNWQAVATTLKSLNGDPEQIRRGILGYFSKVLLGRDDVSLAQKMSCFQNPLYDTGKPGLILQCFIAKKK